MEFVDILIVVVYIGYSIASGFGGSKAASQNLVEYFLAGRSLKGWQAGVSMAATQFAADTPLAVTGLIATAGVFSLWRFWVYALAFLLMALVLGASWRRSGVITDAGLTEVRYGGASAAALRLTKAIYFGFIFNCTVLAMVLLATTRITEPFLVWHEWLPAGLFDVALGIVKAFGFPLTASGVPCGEGGVCEAGSVCLRDLCRGEAEWIASTDNVLSIGAIVLVTTLYSTTGGLRAVVKTDIAQFFIAILATVIYAWVVVDEVGGLGAMAEKIGEMFPADRSGPAPAGEQAMTASEVLGLTPSVGHDVTMAFIGVLMIQWICQINADGSGYLAQRTMGCRSDEDARSAGVIFTVLQILFRSLIWLPIGLCLLILYAPEPGLSDGAYGAKAEWTFVLGIKDKLPAGVKGLMITGMLGALASTVDTHLNWGSSYFTNDVYKRFLAKRLFGQEPSPKSLVWVARGSNLMILALALSVVPLMDNIVTAWQTSLLLGAGVGVLLVLRWLWWRMNAWGELAALIGSLIYAPVLILLSQQSASDLEGSSWGWLVSSGLHGVASEDATRLLVMAFLATSTGIAAALLTPAEDSERLQVFYERTRPPGFWGPFAKERRADDVRRLAYNLGATFGGAASIFLLLLGVGTWMIGGPAPTWWFPWDGFPGRALWIGTTILLGAGLAPLWFKMGKLGKSPESEAEPELLEIVD